jgi:hypothetical protein
LRIEVRIHEEYVAKVPVNNKARNNVGIFVISEAFAITNRPRHSPTIKKTLRVVVKMKSEGEKCTSVSPLFFFLSENGANPNNRDT